MNNNDFGNMMIGFGIIGIIISALVFVYGINESININEIAELKEANYMQTHYGYKDNMDEYLDYLKVNNFGEYLELKSVFDDIHSHDEDWYWTAPALLIALFGMVTMIIGAVYKI